MRPSDLPLAACADRAIRRLARLTRSARLAALDGAALLCERAALAGMRIPGRISAGGGCRLFAALDDSVALNLARPADRELLPALLEDDALDARDHAAIARLIGASEAAALVRRGRSMGLAIAAEQELPPCAAAGCIELSAGCPAPGARRSAPRVIDLSALWAGPLAAHLLWLAGAEVVKVESRTRPDAMRFGDERFYALLNQGKASVAVNLADAEDRRALAALIAGADIVIEAARPRALAQLGIDAAQIVRTTPGLVWLSITGHGASGEAAGWVGFGDDCGVCAGLSAALRAASGRGGFVGDAIADPLTGVFAALAGWEAWASRRGGRFGLAMSHLTAHCLAAAREEDAAALHSSLAAWSAAAGRPFPAVRRRPIGTLPAFGANTRASLAGLAPS